MLVHHIILYQTKVVFCAALFTIIVHSQTTYMS